MNHAPRRTSEKEAGFVSENPARPDSDLVGIDDPRYYARLFRAQQARAAARVKRDDAEPKVNVVVQLPPPPPDEPPEDERAVAIDEVSIDPGSLVATVPTVTLDVVPPAEGTDQFTVAVPAAAEYVAIRGNGSA